MKILKEAFSSGKALQVSCPKGRYLRTNQAKAQDLCTESGH